MASYLEKLKDPQWQKKRLEIFQRDDFTCQECFAEDKTLHVHHIEYFSSDPWETPDDYLITLCETCHKHEEDAKKIDLYSLINDCRLTKRTIMLLLKYISFIVKKTGHDYHSPYWALHNEVIKRLVKDFDSDEIGRYFLYGEIEKGSAKIAQPDHEQSEVEKQ